MTPARLPSCLYVYVSQITSFIKAVKLYGIFSGGFTLEERWEVTLDVVKPNKCTVRMSLCWFHPRILNIQTTRFRFSLTVWTTSWEKTWRGWRRSGPTVGSGTSGGKTNLLSLGAEVNVVHLELTSNCRCFLLAVSVFVASTQRPPAAVDAQLVCPRRSKGPVFSCLNKITSCQIYHLLFLYY